MRLKQVAFSIRWPPSNLKSASQLSLKCVNHVRTFCWWCCQGDKPAFSFKNHVFNGENCPIHDCGAWLLWQVGGQWRRKKQSFSFHTEYDIYYVLFRDSKMRGITKNWCQNMPDFVAIPKQNSKEKWRSLVQKTCN